MGDAGINFSGGERDRLKKEYLESLPITIFAIHGNHERRPQTIDTYKEKLQQVIADEGILKTDYENAIPLKDSDFDGKFEYENGVFSCKTASTSSVAASIQEVNGNGYEGNKYVKNSEGYQEKVIATNNRHSAVDNNVSTY